MAIDTEKDIARLLGLNYYGNREAFRPPSFDLQTRKLTRNASDFNRIVQVMLRQPQVARSGALFWIGEDSRPFAEAISFELRRIPCRGMPQVKVLGSILECVMKDLVGFNILTIETEFIRGNTSLKAVEQASRIGSSEGVIAIVDYGYDLPNLDRNKGLVSGATTFPLILKELEQANNPLYSLASGKYERMAKASVLKRSLRR